MTAPDLTGDGHPDLIVLNRGEGESAATPRVHTWSIQLNDGQMNFGPKLPLTTAELFFEPFTANINGRARPASRPRRNCGLSSARARSASSARRVIWSRP